MKDGSLHFNSRGFLCHTPALVDASRATDFLTGIVSHWFPDFRIDGVFVELNASARNWSLTLS
jgi:hypothetical protein